MHSICWYKNEMLTICICSVHTHISLSHRVTSFWQGSETALKRLSVLGSWGGNSGLRSLILFQVKTLRQISHGMEDCIRANRSKIKYTI